MGMVTKQRVPRRIDRLFRRLTSKIRYRSRGLRGLSRDGCGLTSSPRLLEASRFRQRRQQQGGQHGQGDKCPQTPSSKPPTESHSLLPRVQCCASVSPTATLCERKNRALTPKVQAIASLRFAFRPREDPSRRQARLVRRCSFLEQSPRQSHARGRRWCRSSMTKASPGSVPACASHRCGWWARRSS
jgi:hypothetical protein